MDTIHSISDRNANWILKTQQVLLFSPSLRRCFDRNKKKKEEKNTADESETKNFMNPGRCFIKSEIFNDTYRVVLYLLHNQTVICVAIRSRLSEVDFLWQFERQFPETVWQSWFSSGIRTILKRKYLCPEQLTQLENSIQNSTTNLAYKKTAFLNRTSNFTPWTVRKSY